MPTRFHNPVFLDDLNIHEALDPVFPQDVATKNYVDDKVGGDSGNEVAIQDDPPTESFLELWVDRDAPETPIQTGSDEVFIQTNEPVEATAELWLDLDEPNMVDVLTEKVDALIAEVASLRAEVTMLRGGE